MEFAQSVAAKRWREKGGLWGVFVSCRGGMDEVRCRLVEAFVELGDACRRYTLDQFLSHVMWPTVALETNLASEDTVLSWVRGVLPRNAGDIMAQLRMVLCHANERARDPAHRAMTCSNILRGIFMRKGQPLFELANGLVLSHFFEQVKEEEMCHTFYQSMLAQSRGLGRVVLAEMAHDGKARKRLLPRLVVYHVQQREQKMRTELAALL